MLVKNNNFISLSAKSIFWQIFNEIVEYQDLHRNKDVLQNKILKNSYFISLSAKSIFWQIFNEIVEYQDLYRNKDDL